ncbi:MAG TPA: GAF domain-containing sensor histidine kinase [Terriglobales bacterium]|nr:GAF domain-containing sensor histidine kinase [Terriglobales bacterium]
MSSVLSLKDSSRELLVEILGALNPYYADVTERWREQVAAEFGFARRELGALERLSLNTAHSFFSHGDLPGFFENVDYFGMRLAKLQVDTRAVARSMEIYQELCEPYLSGLFGNRLKEVIATLDVLKSGTFVTVSGAYFDAKTREFATLLRVLDAELAFAEVSTMFEKVLEITSANFNASMAGILLRQPEGDGFKLECSLGVEGLIPDDTQFELERGFCGSLASTGEPEMILDVANDPRILHPAVKERATSLWGVPLRSGKNVIGAMVLGFARPYEWLPNERDLMRAIADRTVMAIERSQMTEELRSREARIAELSAHLLAVQEDERKRISRELHDETGQSLMVIRLYLGMLEAQLSGRTAKAKIRETVSVVDRTIEGIRRIIARLSPLVLQELGLVAAIRKEAKDLAKATGVKARVAIGEDVGRLAPEIEAAIYRVVQESLHNVAKHAQAKSASVQMSRHENTVYLTIEDDGIGMPTKVNSPRSHSFGLAGIKERIASLDGEVRVHSEKGKGTRLEIMVPAGQYSEAMSQSA